MNGKRNVEVFTATCPICEATVQLVNEIACDSCEVEVIETTTREGAARAEQVGVQTLPAVAVNGKLASCCVDTAANETALRQTGIGQPL